MFLSNPVGPPYLQREDAIDFSYHYVPEYLGCNSIDTLIFAAKLGHILGQIQYYKSRHVSKLQT